MVSQDLLLQVDVRIIRDRISQPGYKPADKFVPLLSFLSHLFDSLIVLFPLPLLVHCFLGVGIELIVAISPLLSFVFLDGLFNLLLLWAVVSLVHVALVFKGTAW